MNDWQRASGNPNFAYERAMLWALTVLLVVTIAAIVRSESKWQTFAKENNCEPVADVQMKEMKGYLCDDGVTYWR